jgi:hypothetical protein
MLLSRCTALVLGAGLSFGLPATLRAGDSVDPAAADRLTAPPRLAAFGVASHRLIREDPGGGRLWWFFDAEGKPLGSLEYRPPSAEAAPDMHEGDVYTLKFKQDTLVARTAGPRAVLQRNDDPPVAYVYDEKVHRFVTDSSPQAEAANRPLGRLLSALVDAVRKEGWTPAQKWAPSPQRDTDAPVEPLEGEPPCSGDSQSNQSFGIVRTQACDIATAAVNNECSAASTGACVGCCQLSSACDCACLDDTDFYCWCTRYGRACAPGCPPENNPPSGCQPQNCGVNCYQVARDRVPSGHRVIGGTCNFATDCQCDAWVNTCNPANNARDTVYSGVQTCADPCPPPCNSVESCGNQCGGGMCVDPNPTCCFDSYCAGDGADCCSDGGSCPSGWECCDDGTSSCCPGGYQCCWLEDGPMCCDWGGDSRPDKSMAPLRTEPRLPKNPSAISPKNPKE